MSAALFCLPGQKGLKVSQGWEMSLVAIGQVGRLEKLFATCDMRREHQITEL